MNLALFKPIETLDDVRFHPGANALSLDKLEECYGITFSEDHLLALHESNGVEAYGGYIRLFGVETDNSIDILQWNNNNIGNLHGMADVPNTCVFLKRLGEISMPIILTNFKRVFRVYIF